MTRVRCRGVITRRASALALAVATIGAVQAAPARAQAARAAPPAASGVGGDLGSTEQALYAALRRAPRNPGARAALGDWLASRGQLKSGAVLLEEARLFGADASAIGARLVHVYAWLRDWPSLAALPASPLSSGEKERARVLAERGSEWSGADTTVVVFAPLEIGALGRLPLVIGTDTVWAEVDPQVEGIVLPGLRRGAGLVDVLGEDARGSLGIVRECALGGITLRQVPVRLDASLGAGRARLGFDVFAQLAPTVDGRAGTVILRREGRVAIRAGDTGVPIVLGFPGVQLAVRAGAPLVPVASPAGRAALRGRVWTVDLRRGMLWVGAAR